MRRVLGVLVGLLSLVTVGCYVAYYSPYYYHYGHYDPYYYGYDAAFVYGSIDPLAGGVYYSKDPGSSPSALSDPDSTAAAIASAAGRYYSPEGCAQATASGSVVRYVFTQCTGPLGQVLNGTVSLTVTDAGGQRTLASKSSDLTVDGQPYALDLEAIASQVDGQDSVAITSRSQSPAQVDTRLVQGSIVWSQGSNCVEINGQGESKRENLTVTSTVEGYKHCKGHCPASGKVTVHAPEGDFVTLFDGSSTIQVTDPSAKTQTFEIACD